jgi:hypothetical protein
MREMDETANQQACPDEQYERNTNLRHHQDFSQPGCAARTAVRETGGLERFLYVDSSRRHCGNDAK